MKNFPHQFSNLDTLTQALEVAGTLIDKQLDYANDGVFGEALVRAGIYSFRSLAGSIEQRLSEEKKKDPGSQGFRTAARDIRRFFLIAGIIHHSADGTYALARIGKDIIGAGKNIPLRNAIWRKAMLEIKLADEQGNVSHPYRILSKLIADHPGMAVAELLLALEAKDDSEKEYKRISTMAGKGRDQIIALLGITEANAMNAVKILPSIAEQVGDLVRKGGKVYSSTPTLAPTEDTLNNTAPTHIKAGFANEPRAVAANAIAALPDFKPVSDATFDLSAAIEMRRRRTIAHQQAVASLARTLEESGYALYEDPYDCLAYKKSTGAILIEVKTLDGSLPDQHRQAAKALGQLKSYGYFNIPTNLKKSKLVEIVAFTERPDARIIDFMRANNIRSIWLENGYWVTSSREGNISNLSLDDLFAAL